MFWKSAKGTFSKKQKMNNRGVIRLCVLNGGSIKMQRDRKTAISLKYGHDGKKENVVLTTVL